MLTLSPGQPVRLNAAGRRRYSRPRSLANGGKPRIRGFIERVGWCGRVCVRWEGFLSHDYVRRELLKGGRR